MPPPVTSTRQPRRLPPAERRGAIVAAALKLFAARPEQEIGLEDIAAAAGITRNLLYRYFDSRAAIHRAAAEEAVRRLAQTMVIDPGTPLVEKSPGNIAAFLDTYEEQDPAMLLLQRAATSQDAEVAAVAGRARGLLVRGIAANHLQSLDPPPAVIAALHGYLALAESLIAAWLDHGTLTRAQVETALAAALPPLIAAVR